MRLKLTIWEMPHTLHGEPAVVTYDVTDWDLKRITDLLAYWKEPIKDVKIERIEVAK